MRERDVHQPMMSAAYSAPRVRRLGAVAAVTQSQNEVNADDGGQPSPSANPFVPPEGS
jgi:hypothetical protein